ncbi:MAG TPA: hypothetical protein VLM75_07435 [Spirochaetota bacterium]|nr:hypothetical protein [Spirochaetota bacterium]
MRIIMRALGVWLIIIAAETLHGILRAFFLVPVLGEMRSARVGMPVGALIILLITLLLAKWMRARRVGELLGVGALWTVLTFIFEAVIGLYGRGYSWERILAEYDPFDGGLMSIGLAFMFVCPLIAARLRGMVKE